MDFTKYQELSQRTNTQDKTEIQERLTKLNLDSLHALIGISTESGELLDAFKKHIFYGKAIDQANIKEEIGDLMWYVALLCNANGFDFYKILETNIEKLKARYPEGFKKEQATDRNLAKEREILEK